MKEGRVQMYTITHIYEADFGCEERADGAKAKCVVYLEDENGRQRHVEVEDEVVRTRLFRGRKLLWKEMDSHE